MKIIKGTDDLLNCNYLIISLPSCHYLYQQSQISQISELHDFVEAKCYCLHALADRN